MMRAPGKMMKDESQPSTLVLAWSGCLGCMLFGQRHLAKAYESGPLVNPISVSLTSTTKWEKDQQKTFLGIKKNIFRGDQKNIN